MGPPHIAIFTHVKYSPLASSVRVIYVAFAVIQHQIFSHSLIKQIGPQFMVQKSLTGRIHFRLLQS
jgi:hypothetical protein